MKETVCITGASAGFGESCVRRFAKGGKKLVLVARRLERLQQLQNELGGPKMIHIVQLDVRDKNLVKKAFESLPADFSEIDLLINSAGLALGVEFAYEADVENWETMIDTNIKGLVYCTREILPGMVKRKSGYIMNVGSTAGNWPYPGGNVYGATKSFVQQFSRNLRAELVGRGIRVSNIEPGLAETEFSIVRFKGDKNRASKVYDGTDPLTGEDIAEIAWWLYNLPPHVNVNTLEVMPTCQAWGPLAIDRK
ncbi:MAG: SDR family NAD(P)-dependent oxidoreductase [Calditrichae bacterium]|nr:SDR family NAD(P)-dependent oxidoreductase [Calditrichia bacterium]